MGQNMDWGSRISLILNEIWFVPIEDQSRNQFNDLLITSTCKISTESALPSHLKKHLLKYMLYLVSKNENPGFIFWTRYRMLLYLQYITVVLQIKCKHDMMWTSWFNLLFTFYNTTYLLKSVSLDLWASLILITQCCVFNIHKPGW